MGWRMVSVGAGANELVIGGDADFAAPVAAEMAAGPEGEEDAGDFDGEAGDGEDAAGGQEAACQAWQGEDEEEHGGVEDDEMEAAGPDGLRGLGGCAVFGGGAPVDAEEADEGDGEPHAAREIQPVEAVGRGVAGDEPSADDAADGAGEEHLEDGFGGSVHGAQARGAWAMSSRMRRGEISGRTMASGRTRKVCSRAYWPARTAWGTVSV